MVSHPVVDSDVRREPTVKGLFDKAKVTLYKASTCRMKYWKLMVYKCLQIDLQL